MCMRSQCGTESKTGKKRDRSGCGGKEKPALIERTISKSNENAAVPPAKGGIRGKAYSGL